MKCNNVNYLYRKNAQGDITHILDNTGMVVAKYIYDAWGNHAILDANGNDLASGVGILNPFRYRSYYYDEETDLYYLQTRYYDPEVGRFISQDDVSYLDPDSSNGLNLYAYCANNPVMATDPTGTDWWNPFSWFDNVSNGLKIIMGTLLFMGAVGLTIFTGGFLTPVFIGMALSVGLGTLIGGFSSVVFSGGDWSQFGQGAWDGFADGVLWGGIFALAGATIGAIKYAVKGGQGALAGTTKMITIKKGQMFDRFGSEYGRFITDVGTDISKLALPATNSGVKITLQATKNFRVFTGIIAPNFGGAGGGVQYVLRYSIKVLLKKGWLIIV